MRHLLNEADEVPAGHKTREQWGDEWKTGETRTRALLRKLIKAGIAGTSSHRILNGGVIRPIPHYYQLTNDSRTPKASVRQGVTTGRKGNPAGRKGPSASRRNT